MSELVIVICGGLENRVPKPLAPYYRIYGLSSFISESVVQNNLFVTLLSAFNIFNNTYILTQASLENVPGDKTILWGQRQYYRKTPKIQ